MGVGGEGEEASNLPEQNRPGSPVCQKGEVETGRESAGVPPLDTTLPLVLPVWVTWGAQEGGPEIVLN